ncbi:hypothetical protein QBC40DRAFT_254631 [Triangularia verruculosa]|uniref:Uncharacterized protein n=1 Tax=Triangularia verruculosa TaxID=2587418 RepID=A0AAN6XLE2_9PEZI|nr:hypothetical protein QBC40DRAFT_254631 [Triangularia verruculosa]
MWDVDWSDVSTERVGERRARKGIEKKSKKDGALSAQGSTGSRPSSAEERPAMSLFESMGLKRNSLSMRSRKKDALQQETTKDDGKSRRTSLLSAAVSALGNTNRSSMVSDKSLKVQTIIMDKEAAEETAITSPTWGVQTDRSSKESMLSKSTALTTPSVEYHVEGTTGDLPMPETPKPARPMSDFVQTTITPNRNPVRVASLGGKPAILLNDTMPHTPANQNPRSVSALSAELEKSVSDFIDNWYEVVHASDRPTPVTVLPHKQHSQLQPKDAGMLPPMAPMPRGPLPNIPSRPPPRPSQARMLSTLPPSYELKANYNPDNWKSPKQWGAKSRSARNAPLPTSKASLATNERPVPVSEAPRVPSENPSSPAEASPAVDKTPLIVPKKRVCLPRDTEAAYAATLGVIALQIELKRMAQANPQVALTRLSEDWGTVTDPTIYQQLEQEKKRWMMASLHGLEQQARNGDNSVISVAGARPFLKGPDTLLLFDSHSTVSYLAALHPETNIRHMNSTPIPPLLYSNVESFPWPVSPSLALEANKFASVHCLSMPSLLASQEIPQLLRKIYKCLAPRGALHLVVIDPSPVAHSLGPRMRDWLEEHLTINLEAEFRCVTPSRVFPRWLEAAKLNGPSSVTTKSRFQAIAPSQSRNDNGKGKAKEIDPREESEVVGDIRTIVGRMLWQEVWGKNVRGTAWWWQIPECVEECIQLGTYWEYSIIQAVKEEDDLDGHRRF